jgi:lysophospholipid acyltransferase (LPLAT)-like uncharacterized protein
LLYPLIGHGLLLWRWFVHRTVRVDRRGAAFEWLRDGKPFIFTYWHGDSFPLIFEMSRSFDDTPPLYMVSPGRTGAFFDYVFGLFKIVTVAGSRSSKGWEAIDNLVERYHAHPQSIFILADGSRGPNQDLRWGALNLAKETGMPIIAGRAYGNNLFSIRKLWMKPIFPLPIPWKRTVVLTSDPLFVPADSTHEQMIPLHRELQRRLDTMGQDARAYFTDGPTVAERYGPRYETFPRPNSAEPAATG